MKNFFDNSSLKKIAAIACLALGGLAGSNAYAVPVIGAGASIAEPTTTLTFSEVALAGSTALSNQFAAYGVTFSGLFYTPCTNCVEVPARPDAGNFNNNNTSTFNSGFDIFFANDVSGASFSFASNGGTFSFQAYNNGTLVESFLGNGSTWGNYGFDGLAFDRIHVSTPSAMLLDNLAFRSDVPEPAPLALLGLGMFGLLAARRRKQM